MATATSAVTGLTNVQREFHQNFAEMFADEMSFWSDISSVIAGQGADQTTLRQGELVLDGSALAPQVDDPTPANITGVSSTITATVYEKKYTLTLKDIADDPFLVRQLGQSAARNAWNTVHEQIMAVLTNATTTASPLDGSALVSANGGGTLNICDSYDISHPQGTVTSAQNNSSTTALSRAAVLTDINTRWSFVNWMGTPLSDYTAKPVLLVPSDLRATVDEIEGLTSSIDVSGTIENPVRQHLAGIKYLPGAAADADDWWMWWYGERTVENDDGSVSVVRMAPINPWMRKLPSTRVAEDAGSNHAHFHVCYEGGIQVSHRAHFDLLMHAV